jgi:hypothetical protein
MRIMVYVSIEGTRKGKRTVKAAATAILTILLYFGL